MFAKANTSDFVFSFFIEDRPIVCLSFLSIWRSRSCHWNIAVEPQIGVILEEKLFCNWVAMFSLKKIRLGLWCLIVKKLCWCCCRDVWFSQIVVVVILHRLIVLWLWLWLSNSHFAHPWFELNQADFYQIICLQKLDIWIKTE